MAPAGNPSLSDRPWLLNWGKLEAKIYRLIDKKLFPLPNILGINKEGAFKDLEPNDKIDILAKTIGWGNL
jgi:hypothetical protein